MKRGHDAVEEQDESDWEPSAKRIVQDTATATNIDVTKQSWTQMFASILGVQEIHDDDGIAVHLDDTVDGVSVPIFTSIAEEPLGHTDPEEVGRRIGTWVEATMNECAKPRREDDKSWQTPTSETDSSENDRTQCFGMIHKCRVRLYGEMEDLRNKLARVSLNKTHERLQYVTTSDTGFFRLEDGTLCAQLDHHLYDPLNRIIKVESVRLLTYALIEDWISIMKRARRHKDVEMNIDINVYGSAGVRSVVGQMLSEDSLYLQHVKHCEEDVEYENPHMLVYEDCDESDYGLDFDNLEVGNSNLEQAPQTIWDTCLAETSNQNSREYEVCAHVRVPLLLHQKQAVPFMIEREIGPIVGDRKLWKWTEDENRSGFQHSITGCWTTEARQEFGGGVLADDPGMGKTLSTLSLIAQRLVDAQSWCQTHNDDHKTNTRASVRSRATLVVVPSLPIIAIWLEQINNFMDGSLKVLKHHGKSRYRQVEEILDTDIVFTTYHTLAMERKKRKNPLQSINWFRVVLDEAHYIRRQATTLYAAVSELDACHRWCLTGTPIQNELEDFGALLAFIRADPFHSISMFRKYVVSPFSYDPEGAKENLSLLLSSVCMRRRINRLNLPPIKERRSYVDFSESERDLYRTTLDTMFWDLKHGPRGKGSGKIFERFQIQLQLRRLCNHGTFQKSWSPTQIDLQAQREDVISSMGKDGEISCSFCNELIPLLSASCDARRPLHLQTRIFCDECANIEGTEAVTAPVEDMVWVSSRSYCTRSIGSTLGDSYKESNAGSCGHSSKIEKLMKDVRCDLSNTKR